MDILQIVERVRAFDKVPSKKPKKNEKLDAFGGKTPKELIKMMRSMLTARRIEREEKLLLRKGYNRFFIGCGGKELMDVCLAEALRPTEVRMVSAHERK